MNEVVTVDLSLLQYSPKPIVYSNSVNSIRIIQTSRNCVFNCTYCSQGPKKMWRTFSYKRIKGVFRKYLSKQELWNLNLLMMNFSVEMKSII